MIFDCVAVELQDMVSSPTQVKSTVQLESRNGNTGLEIDWGEMAADDITPEQSDRTGFEESEIDFNIDAVDLSVITIEDSGEGEEERGNSVTVIPETSEGEDLEPQSRHCMSTLNSHMTDHMNIPTSHMTDHTILPVTTDHMTILPVT